MACIRRVPFGNVGYTGVKVARSADVRGRTKKGGSCSERVGPFLCGNLPSAERSHPLSENARDSLLIRPSPPPPNEGFLWDPLADSEKSGGNWVYEFVYSACTGG